MHLSWFLTVTPISLFLPKEDTATVYGYPERFYVYESSISPKSKYKSHTYIPIKFIIDLAYASFIGLLASVYRCLYLRVSNSEIYLLKELNTSKLHDKN